MLNDGPQSLALCFLDLVGSTQFISRWGSAHASRVFAAHDQLTRSLLYRYTGIEIDRSDGFLLVFERCIDALDFALEYQRNVPDRTGLQTRIGIHWGEVLVRSNRAIDVAAGAKPREVEGLPKPTAARVMSLAEGGMVLLSHAAYQRCTTRHTRHTPRTLQYKNIGTWSLKGVSRPLQLYAAGVERGVLRLPAESSKCWRVAAPPKTRTKWTGYDLLIFMLRGCALGAFGWGMWCMVRVLLWLYVS
jgi:class 3 adenylate cyclase